MSRGTRRKRRKPARIQAATSVSPAYAQSHECAGGAANAAQPQGEAYEPVSTSGKALHAVRNADTRRGALRFDVPCARGT